MGVRVLQGAPKLLPNGPEEQLGVRRPVTSEVAGSTPVRIANLVKGYTSSLSSGRPTRQAMLHILVGNNHDAR